MSNKVLVVEDEKSLSAIIEKKMELQGIDCVVVNDVDSALVALKKNDIDALWLDHYLLGKENGLDLVRSIKETENWKNIPIFVVSNTASPDKMQTYLQFGVQKYYVKAEHTLEEIISSIEDYLTSNNKD